MNNEEEEALIRVGPGTPSGAVFRRYWLPVEASANLGSGRGDFAGTKNPLRVRALGEDLVLFRDGVGKPSLLAEHCSHRGTSLFYGRVEDNCLRCLYHGWAFDGEGNLVDTPAEPPESNFKRTVKHRAYPVIEVAGLIFAYLGPPDKKPIFPKYELLFREDGVRVTGNGRYVEQCNVFQAMHDNNLDPWHGEVLDSWFKRADGRPGRDVYLHWGENGDGPSPLKFERTPWGTRYVDVKKSRTSDQYEYHETHTVWPCQRYKRWDVKWAVPVDDYHTRWFEVAFHPFGNDGKPTRQATRAMSRSEGLSFGHSAYDLPPNWAEQVGSWWNFGHPWRQGVVWEDEVAQATQGPAERHYLPDWERWRLGSSDRGLMLNREVWREQVERVGRGLDPIHVTRDPRDDELIVIPGENVRVTYQQGLEWFNMTPEERLDLILQEGRPAAANPVGQSVPIQTGGF